MSVSVTDRAMLDLSMEWLRKSKKCQKNWKKCFSQFSRAQSVVFKSLILSKPLIYSQDELVLLLKANPHIVGDETSKCLTLLIEN